MSIFKYLYIRLSLYIYIYIYIYRATHATPVELSAAEGRSNILLSFKVNS